MRAYQSTLLGRREVAEDTIAFQFEKPRDFMFKAGQYIDLTPSGSQHGSSDGLTHTFSIANSPFDEDLLVTTRIRNTVFKQALSILPIGGGATIDGPMGSFTLHNPGQLSSSPAVLGSHHSSACCLTQQGRSFAILFFCSTQTATWRMPHS
jgi:ferredoxin-NADP reductase